MDNFIFWWQHLPENLSPVIFQVGSFRIQWYGLMYILAFLTTYGLARYRTQKEARFHPYTEQFLKDILTAAFIGVLLGGRLGYVLFYNLQYYLQNPLEIILPFRFDPFEFVGISGMSYHGGLIGVLVSVWIFCRRRQVSYWRMADLFSPIIPLGYTFGRIGNFINGELYGRVTEASIGMYFPSSPEKVLRHPSQLYEALFEGVFCFLLMWSLRMKKIPEGAFVGIYLMSYGGVRFLIEFTRQPDSHLGLVFLNFFSMGQLLCIGMILVGALLFFYRWSVAKKVIEEPKK